jgi:hypothetical protein
MVLDDHWNEFLGVWSELGSFPFLNRLVGPAWCIVRAVCGSLDRDLRSAHFGHDQSQIVVLGASPTWLAISDRMRSRSSMEASRAWELKRALGRASPHSPSPPGFGAKALVSAALCGRTPNSEGALTLPLANYAPCQLDHLTDSSYDLHSKSERTLLPLQRENLDGSHF